MSAALELRDAVVEPPIACADLPGVGGRLRCRPEDFAVEELPAYEADGRSGHLLVWLRKRGRSSEEAVREVAAQLDIPRAEIGLAGLKDRWAVTRQRISVPERAAAALERFEHRDIELEPIGPHSHKLRRGHLAGNRFVLVLRELSTTPAIAVARARDLFERLASAGLRNFYGVQRFGRDGRNIEGGLAALAGRGRRRGKGDLLVSAGQSALFNAYLTMRIDRGLLGRVLLGDVLQTRARGGLFCSSEPEVDQRRLDAGELVGTGPMFGSKMFAPSPGSPAAALEAELLARVGLSADNLARLGRKVPGTRRRLRIWPQELAAAEAPAVGEFGPGLELRFVLPAGSYATIVVRELNAGPERCGDATPVASSSAPAQEQHADDERGQGRK